MTRETLRGMYGKALDKLTPQELAVVERQFKIRNGQSSILPESETELRIVWERAKKKLAGKSKGRRGHGISN